MSMSVYNAPLFKSLFLCFFLRASTVSVGRFRVSTRSGDSVSTFLCVHMYTNIVERDTEPSDK